MKTPLPGVQGLTPSEDGARRHQSHPLSRVSIGAEIELEYVREFGVALLEDSPDTIRDAVPQRPVVESSETPRVELGE